MFLLTGNRTYSPKSNSDYGNPDLEPSLQVRVFSQSSFLHFLFLVFVRLPKGFDADTVAYLL